MPTYWSVPNHSSRCRMKIRTIEDQQSSWRWLAGITLAVAALSLAAGLLLYRHATLQAFTLCTKAGSEETPRNASSSPALRIYTVNLVADTGPPTIKGGLWWAEFLLISR